MKMIDSKQDLSQVMLPLASNPIYDFCGIVQLDIVSRLYARTSCAPFFKETLNIVLLRHFYNQIQDPVLHLLKANCFRVISVEQVYLQQLRNVSHSLSGHFDRG